MKKIYINRHAKSSWDNQQLSDFDRPLNKRGLRDAPFMAQVFADRNPGIDLIISSPANRAITTAEFFADALGIAKADIQLDERIYHASTDQLLQVINDIDDKYSNVILFGHNPGFTYIVEKISGDWLTMATCAIAGIGLHVDSWSAVSMNTGSLFHHDYPKNHVR